jgi:hypothetical protein
MSVSHRELYEINIFYLFYFLPNYNLILVENFLVSDNKNKVMNTEQIQLHRIIRMFVLSTVYVPMLLCISIKQSVTVL